MLAVGGSSAQIDLGMTQLQCQGIPGVTGGRYPGTKVRVDAVSRLIITLGSGFVCCLLCEYTADLLWSPSSLHCLHLPTGHLTGTVVPSLCRRSTVVLSVGL